MTSHFYIVHNDDALIDNEVLNQHYIYPDELY